MGNIYVVLLAALIPMLVGAIYYGPIFGKAWMNANNFVEEDLKKGNLFLIFGLSYVLSVFLGLGLSGLTNHQSGVLQLMAMHPDFHTPGTEVAELYKAVMDKFGTTHRNFGHGAVHGIINSVLIVLPLISINALFERRGWKYILIHFGYWLITLTIMGGFICQWF